MTGKIERVMDAILAKSPGHIYEVGQLREMAIAAVQAAGEQTQASIEAALAEAPSAEWTGGASSVGQLLPAN